jgi:hypothetical protein
VADELPAVGDESRHLGGVPFEAVEARLAGGAEAEMDEVCGEVGMMVANGG